MSVDHYKEDTFPYACKYHLQGRPIHISYDEYVKYFRPRIRVAKNKFVTAPKFGLAGLCLDISRHKKKAQKKVKVKPFGSEEIKKVPLGSVFGLPELTGGSNYFLRDMRSKFWYKGIKPMSGEGLKIDAVMVRLESAEKEKQTHTQKGGGNTEDNDSTTGAKAKAVNVVVAADSAGNKSNSAKIPAASVSAAALPSGAPPAALPSDALPATTPGNSG